MRSTDNRISSVIENSLKNLGSIIDVDTVIGKPINGKNGECIIPFSKVTFGVLTGGGEYGKVTFFKGAKDLPYSAGNSSIINIKPCGFLIKNNHEDSYKIVSVNETGYEKFLEKATDFLSKYYEEK